VGPKKLVRVNRESVLSESVLTKFNCICDTKPAIVLKRSGLELKLLQSVYRNSCTAYRLVTIWWPRVNFGLLFREANFSTTDISQTFCRSVTKFGRFRGLANRNLFPKFPEFWSSGPTIPCIDMHQSFTDALVKWFFDNFGTSQCLPIVLDWFIFTALPED